MAEDAPTPGPVTKGGEFPAEAELRVRNIGQRIGTLPHSMDELLWLLGVSAAPIKPLCFCSACHKNRRLVFNSFWNPMMHCWLVGDERLFD
jgi:hypothetical protein